MTDTIIRHLGDVLDAITVIYLFDVLFGKNNKLPKKFIYLIFISFTVVSYIGIELLDNSIVNMGFSFVYIIVLSFFYRANVMERIICVVTFNIIAIGVEFTTAAILTYILGNNAYEQYYLVGMVLSKILVLICVPVISQFVKNKHHQMDTRYRICIIISLFFSMAAIILLCDITSIQTEEYIPRVGMVAIAIVILDFLIYYMMDSISETVEVGEREKLLNYEIAMRDKQFQQLSASYRQFRSILHDTNKHFKVVSAMVEHNENKKAVEYIEKTLKEVNGAYRKINTGNMVIDTLVSNLFSRGEEVGVLCQSDILVRNDQIKIDNHDLTVILGNLLDNALNAAQYAGSPDKKTIRITIITDKNKFMIDISNFYNKEISKSFEKSYGIENIESVVNKNGGIYNIKADDEKYNATIIFYHSIL